MRQMILLKLNDLGGKSITTGHHTLANPEPDTTLEDGWIAAYQAISKLGVVAVELQPVLEIGTTPQTGSYATVDDLARFRFRTTTGRIVEVKVWGPDSSIFLPDNETVDQSNVAVVEFIDQCKDALASSDGDELAELIDARRLKYNT